MGAPAEAGPGPPPVRYGGGRGARARRNAAEDLARAGQLEEDIAWLKAAVSPYSIELTPRAQDRLLAFARELISWNSRLNLLSRSDAHNVIRKHVAASLGVFLAAQPAPREKWIDVGTGGGFPGLVLKLVRPELDMTLLESSRKRCLFLENVIRQVGAGPVPVLALRVETLLARGDGVGAYDLLTARAVASLRDTLLQFGPLVTGGGRIITFKGPAWQTEIEAVEQSGELAASGFRLESVTRIPWALGHLLTLRRGAAADPPGA